MPSLAAGSGRYPPAMSCPPIHWKQWSSTDTFFGSFDPTGVSVFAVIGSCVGDRAGQRSIRITRKGRADLWGYAGSVEQAKRHVERWAGRHWRTVGWRA